MLLIRSWLFEAKRIAFKGGDGEGVGGEGVLVLLLLWLMVYIEGIMKRQALGIARNRVDRLIAIKKDAQRKKNRFQIVGKEDDQDSHCSFPFTQ
jgi:hypothetical protein